MDSSMQPLDKSLRNRLDRTVRKARPVAEQAAEAVLEQLGVGEQRVPEYLGESQRKLRQRLRAHARSLGDPLKEGAQAVTRLIGEIAYEHWHRMLFARFLAENELLMYDDVAVTLEECEELAEEEAEQGQRTSGWALAARLASTMLPQVFRVDSPVFELTLAAEYQRELEELLAGLPVEVFHASDSLGWVYQFWQTDNKENINRSEVKIGADELPAVTQLFTEPYMVSFLLDNSLGAWWAARRLSETDLASAKSEQALRDKASLPSVPLEYLRFVKDEETGHWTPAAGTFDAWPQSLAELKTLDPCCGSGHFLVAALLMLVPMRMELEGLSANDAVDAVLRDNLHGLEIDQRCVELAAFALALTAWRYPGTGGYRQLPTLNVACTGLPINVGKDEWLKLASESTEIQSAMSQLYRQFKNAPSLGSLIDPTAELGRDSLFQIEWKKVALLIDKVISKKIEAEQNESAIIAQGLSKSASILSSKFSLTFTNVPFLTQIKFSDELDEHLEIYYKDYKANLATGMIARINKLISYGGTFCHVAPQSWWFLKRYRKTREDYLKDFNINFLARLGERAFESNQANGEQVGLSIVSNVKANNRNSKISILDASSQDSRDKKANHLSTSDVDFILQNNQLKNADCVIIFGEESDHPSLGESSNSYFGSSAGDRARFTKHFWEVEASDHKYWEYLQSSPSSQAHYSGLQECILWEKECGKMRDLAESVKHLNHKAQQWRSGKPNWGKKGLVASLMSPFPASIYRGNIYDTNVCTIVPKENTRVKSLVAFGKNEEFKDSIKSINQNRKVEVKTVLSIPFEKNKWDDLGETSYPRGLPEPYSDDPTQWIFHGHPCGSVIWDEEAKWTAHGPLRTDDTVLQVAVARLLGYRWPAELDLEMELAEEQREWVDRCEALLDHADRDGIVCLPAVRGERRAVDRLEALLADAYGDQWSATTRGKLLESVDHAGKDLESWLRDKFFAQHCKLFQNRPFIWHIWDGLKDGFSALVNYHRLDYKALETLTYTYLGDWITQQKKQIGEGVDGAEGRLAAAEALQKSLELILEGEGYPDQGYGYDIFVRWKPLEEQPIGWHPDLNDGVRLNIRPFLSVPDVKKKGAGVLVHKPNIHWKKDRGKDVESAPWYHLGPQLGGAKGDRINDYHLTLAAKKAARKS